MAALTTGTTRWRLPRQRTRPGTEELPRPVVPADAPEPHTPDYRYERKFLVTALGRAELEMVVRLHPALFLAIYQPRFINNIYLDSPSRESYVEAVEGVKNRVKARIRWYGAAFGRVERPVLEFKVKHGLLGYKRSFPLTPFTVDETFSASMLGEVFADTDLPVWAREHLCRLEPALLNRYRRSYYRSADGRFRITIDTGLTYHRLEPHVNTFTHAFEDPARRVLEVKYAPDDQPTAHRITAAFPFRLTKSSKYVMGLDLTGV